MTAHEHDTVDETEQLQEEEALAARNLPAVRASEAIVARGELTVDEVVEQKDKITQVMKRVMTRDVHYGVIPGVGKPSLLKPGAEAINVALRLAPHYDSEKIWHEDGHLTVAAKCELHHIPTGLVVGTGEGLCTSRESRYAFRNAKRSCPNCGQEAIIKGKAEYGGGWVCWKKEGGCGANFNDDDERVAGQEVGKIANPDLPDTFNTVLKMADKRALVAATLNATAASDVFTQDVEDAGASGGGANGPSTADVVDEERAFDPGRQLLSNAVRGTSVEIVEQLREAQHYLASDLDWSAILEEAATACIGPKDGWDAEQGREFMARWANAIARLQEVASNSADHHPYHPELGIKSGHEGDALIVEAFEFAFGVTPSLPLPKLPTDDVVDAEVVEEAT